MTIASDAAGAGPLAMAFGPDDVVVGSFAAAAADATGTAVIIDVFRAFTTAAIALANGAARIVMVDDLEAALALRDANPGMLCMGERGGRKPPGFDFGNSPLDVRSERFNGRTLVQTTSNGTRGIVAARGAGRVYAAALVNARATGAVIAASRQTPVDVVAMGGSDTRRAAEDELCALLIASRLQGRDPDTAALCRVIRTMSTRRDTRALSEDELACCLDVDSIPFAIRVTVEEGHCVARPEFP